MAITNQERVGKALELLKDGLGPFVEREVQNKIKAGGVHMDTIRRFVDAPHLTDKPIDQWDVAALLKLMWETWNDVFRNVLGHAERSLVSEIRGHRNKWAHQEQLLQRRRRPHPRLHRPSADGRLRNASRRGQSHEDGTAPSNL